MRGASVGRYVIGVRPVLINVFVDDLVEIVAAPACHPYAAAALGRSQCRVFRLENGYANPAAQC
ncbi:hypothetical protein BLAT2472_40054 [Burkholderia latens]